MGGAFGDRYGRLKTIALGTAWAIFGATLQTSAQNHVWMIFGLQWNPTCLGSSKADDPKPALSTDGAREF